MHRYEGAPPARRSTRGMRKIALGAVCGGVAAMSLAFVESTADAAPVASAAYVSVQPCRLADTRLADGYVRVDALTLQIPARGVCGIPANATSVALTLTVVGPQAAGFLTAWPADQARPVVSNVNFDVGQIRANGSITRVGASGAFRVFTSALADVVVDVVGAFVPASAAAAGRFVARPSTRLYDFAIRSCARPGRHDHLGAACRSPVRCRGHGTQRHDHGVLRARLRHRVPSRSPDADFVDSERRSGRSNSGGGGHLPCVPSRCGAVSLRRRPHRRRSSRILHRPLCGVGYRWAVHRL